jgi:hypothetical protein
MRMTEIPPSSNDAPNKFSLVLVPCFPGRRPRCSLQMLARAGHIMLDVVATPAMAWLNKALSKSKRRYVYPRSKYISLDH